MAGGTPKQTHSGAQYYPTPHAKQGDLGSQTLAPAPTDTVWEAGSQVEVRLPIRGAMIRCLSSRPTHGRAAVSQVSWTINANHGGGYSYRSE
jgi:hypothetical protein